MTDRARELVVSTAGSALLCELVGLDVLRVAGVPRDDAQSWIDDVGSRLSAAVGQRPPLELSPRSVLESLYEVVEGLAFGRFDEWHALAMLPDELWEPLLPVAEALVASPAAAWWWDSVTSEQFWIRGADAPAPGPDGRLPTWSHGRPDNDPGVWWVQPSSSPPTSRRIPGDALPVAGVCPDWHERRGPRVEVWSVRLPQNAPVFEVRGPDDWIALIETHPLRVRPDRELWRRWTGRARDDREVWRSWTGWTGDWIVADWSSVARDWAGVHVTVGGWATAAHRLLPVSGGATVLAGWNPDETVWLGDPPVAVDHVTDADLPEGA